MRGAGLRRSGGYDHGGQLLDTQRLGELRPGEDGPLPRRDLGALTDAARSAREAAELESWRALKMQATGIPGGPCVSEQFAREEQTRTLERFLAKVIDTHRPRRARGHA